MSDIVERLTEYSKDWRVRAGSIDVVVEAIAEIKRLREALKPFADEADLYDPPESDDDLPAWSRDFPIGTLRRARAALKKAEGESR